MGKNIVLIGFMGVGKGRTARELSRITGRFSVDTDDLIESVAKSKIRKIFQTEGELFFRRLEQETASWIQSAVTDTIVSTGGGFFMVNNIRDLGHVVYLHSSVESIIDAIKQHPKGARKIKKRPLLQDLNKARELYQQRLPLYRNAADTEVFVEGRSTEEIAREIAGVFGLDI
jgi:shikimate kinase